MLKCHYENSVVRKQVFDPTGLIFSVLMDSLKITTAEETSFPIVEGTILGQGLTTMLGNGR